MTRTILAACLVFACGSNQPSSTTPGPGPATTGSATAAPACEPTDCGPEPPISPSACPTGESISTLCQRAENGGCERHILCNGKDAAPVTPAAAAP